MSRSTSFFGNGLVEAADIPGHQPERMRSFLQIKTFPGVHGQETMDIGPADHQGNKRNQGPGPMGGKEDADDEKTAYGKQQKRESKAQQGDEPPVSGMEEGIGAGQQEKNDGNYV
jgi:hypothetical protein